ncbi:aminotransferase class III-fold pyridoxal phosphate-dependent enzyme [Lentzea alba]|uniref:aminotransferase class III-fold pyridoxal phosphate-dependent enzyme n=1 Tax=Lentzea alba TaxID=2714351 RepID=UPI0039BEDB21
MTAVVAPEVLRSLREGRALHLDHYGSRPPFAAVGGSGITQRMVALEGAGDVIEVLDASGGYASACLGIGHEVIRRAAERAVSLEMATDEIGSLERSSLLVEMFGAGGLLADHFPPGEYHVSGRSSGSEGMELALRLVLESRVDRRSLRQRGDRDLILAFEGAWHGWTSGLVPLLNRRHFQAGLPSAGVTVEHLPFGDAELVEEFVSRHGDRLLAVVVEPIQGDAGVIVPPPGFLRRVARAARARGALVVADEVLTFGKTGAPLAMIDDEGVVPTDITVIGKSLGMGSVPVSMVIARRELTVRGSGAVATSDLRPAVCAVVRDGLKLIVDDKLWDHAAALGEHLGQRLRDELVGALPEVFHEARGLGVLHGVELTEAASARMTSLREHVIRAGAYVEFMAGAGRRTLGRRYLFPAMRFAPALITTPDDVDEIVGRVAEGTRAFLGASG